MLGRLLEKQKIVKALYVDDSEADRVFLERLLGDHFGGGVHLDSVGIIPKMDDLDRYDILIIDHNLGIGESGLSFAFSVHDYDYMLPIVLLTGMDRDSPEVLDANLSVDKIISKDNPNMLLLEIGAAFRQVHRIAMAGGSNLD